MLVCLQGCDVSCLVQNGLLTVLPPPLPFLLPTLNPLLTPLLPYLPSPFLPPCPLPLLPPISSGVAVIRPGCNNTDAISVNSSIVDGISEDTVPDSTITLPPSVFGMADCTNVGVVVVIYDGIGPLLSGDELLPVCVQPTAALVHGRW